LFVAFWLHPKSLFLTSPCSLFYNRLTVELATGTPHGRDRDRWGSAGGPDRGERGGRDRSPPRRSRNEDKPGWMDKYGPPTRTDYKLIVENLSSRISWQVRENERLSVRE